MNREGKDKQRRKGTRMKGLFLSTYFSPHWLREDNELFHFIYFLFFAMSLLLLFFKFRPDVQLGLKMTFLPCLMVLSPRHH